jgi:N-acetylglutamate synthase-like GNAT family acetyltransferase
VTPLTDPAFVAALAADGYAPVESKSLLVAEIAAIRAVRDPRVQRSEDAVTWGERSLRGFLDGAELDERRRRVGVIIASSPGVIALEARDGDEVVATACVSVAGEMAGLFAGSTIPAYRRRGWHEVLVADRLARARELGARYVRVTATPFSDSERNFRRLGFVPVYTKTVWEQREQK